MVGSWHGGRATIAFTVSPVPPFAPRAVVFDLDGVLVETEELWVIAEQRVVADLGGEWDDALRHAMLGRGPRDAAGELARHVGTDDVDGILARLRRASRETFAEGIRPRAGARELVGALGKTLPLAVATNADRDLAAASLHAAGLTDAFTAVVTADDVREHKPAPEVYERACAALGVAPDQAVAFEDSPVGASAARAAGCWVIGCPAVPGLDGIPSAHALIRALDEVSVPRLIAGNGHPG